MGAIDEGLRCECAGRSGPTHAASYPTVTADVVTWSVLNRVRSVVLWSSATAVFVRDAAAWLGDTLASTRQHPGCPAGRGHKVRKAKIGSFGTQLQAQLWGISATPV